MCDFLKEIFQAAQQRIRSPFIGSVIFAFIAVNWQALFYLFFAEVSVAERLGHFKCETDFYTLYVYPIFVGVTFALTMPWLRFIGAWVAVKPASLLADLQGNEASRRRVARLLLKTKEDEALDKANEARELRKINEEKRLQEANKTGGEALVEEIRQGRIVDPSIPQILNQLSEQAKELLKIAVPQGQIAHHRFNNGEQISAGAQGFESKGMERREWSKYVAGLEELVEATLLRPVGNKGQIFEVTAKGYDAAELIEAGEV